MAKFSKTKKQSTFTKTEYKLTDEELQRKNSEAAGIVQQYDEKIASGGYLSAEDLYGYQEAQRTYIDTGNAIRKRLTENGYKFTDADEADWATQVAGMNKHYQLVYDTYSPYADETAFLRGSQWNWQWRQQQYEDNKKRIEELKAQRDNLIPQVSFNPDSNVPLPFYDQGYLSQRRELESQIAELEKQNAQYERGEGDWASKEVDDSYSYYTSEAFPGAGTKRDYKNPSLGVLSQTTDRGDRNQWYYDENGVYRDAYGNALETDEFGNWIDPRNADHVIEDKLGLFLNASEEERNRAAAGDWGINNVSAAFREGIEGDWTYLQDWEIDVYYAYLEESKEKAYQYLANMERELDRRRSMDEQGKWYEEYENSTGLGKVGMNLMTVPANLLGGFGGVVSDASAFLRGEDINPYSTAHSLSNYTRVVRGATSEDLSDVGLLGDFYTMGDLYGAGMSILDTLAASTLPFGSVLLASSAAEGEAVRLYQEGATNEQIAFGAAAAGAAELIFESLSLGELEKIKNMPSPETLGQFFKTLLVQGGVEASEEVLTEIANTVSNAFIMGAGSDWQKLVDEKGAGALLDKTMDALHAGISGFLSGGGTSTFVAGASVINHKAQVHKQNVSVGKTVMAKNGGVDALVDLAKKMNINTAKVKPGNASQVGQLYYAVSEAVSKQTRAALISKLQEQGVSEEAAEKISGVATTFATGGRMTKPEEDLLTASIQDEKIFGAMTEVLLDKESPVRQNIMQLGSLEVSQDATVEDGALVEAEQEMAPEEVQEETVAENHSAVDSAIQGYISSGSVTNRTAESILADPQALDYLQKETGVLITGSVAQKRAAVKAAVTQLAKQTKKGKRTIAPKASEQKAEPKKSEQTTEKKVDMEGKTFLESSGEEVKSISVKRIGKGGSVVTVNGGTEAKLSDVSFGDERTHLAYSRVTSVEGMTAEAANKILSNPKADRFDFINEAIRAFQGGLRNESVAEKLNYDIISADEARAFYEEGRKAAAAQAQAAQKLLDEIYQKAKAEVEKTGKKVNAQLRSADGLDLDALAEDERGDCARLAARMVPALQGDIVLYDGPQDGKMGYYKYGEDAIYLNVNAKFDEKSMMAFVLAHEMVHRGRKGSPLKYQAFADLLIQEFTKKGVSLDMLIQEQLTAAKKAKVTMTEPQAFEEVICDACQRMLVDTNAGRILAEWGERSNQNRDFLTKLKNFLTELFNRLRKVFAGERSENRAVAAFRALDKSVQDMLSEMYVDMTKDAAEKLSVIKAAGMLDKTNTTGEGGVRYSVAGVASQTANMQSLAEAKRQLENGVSPEQIRKETGWFQGYDGMWRYEISDKDMEIDTHGRFHTNPDIRRYNELVSKVYFGDGTATDEDLQELQTLKKNLQGVNMEPSTLGQLIKHDALFFAYPQLKNIAIKFADITERARYSPASKTITIRNDLKADPSQLGKTLVHEIQHAIQDLEGFTGGSSPDYWRQVGIGENAYQKFIANKERERARILKTLTAEERQDYLRYVQTDRLMLEALDMGNIDQAEEFEAENDKLYKKLINRKWFSRLIDIQNVLEEGISEELYTRFYESTAGEIEARDVSARKDLSSDAIKENRPDIDRTDVVLSDSTDNLEYTVPYLDANGNKQTMPTQDYIQAELEKEMATRDELALQLADESDQGIIPQFRRALKDIAVPTKVTEPEGEVSWKTSGEYWHPAMTKTERAEVRSIAKNEANKTDNYLGIDAKWLYNKEKGHEYFAIYSTMDPKEPTVLYACKDNLAKIHYNYLITIVQRRENIRGSIDADAGIAGRLLSNIRGITGGNFQHPGSVMGTGGNNGNASVHSRNRRARIDQAFINCLRNIEEVQQQYGLDDHYQFAVDRNDMETAQRMVDEAAREAEYDAEMFHETDAENIHIFDISRGDHGGRDYQTPYGIFTKSSSKNIGLGSRQMRLFVRAHRTLRVNNRDDVVKKIPGFAKFYDQITQIDNKYSAGIEELEDAELDALSEWLDAHPDVDWDDVYPTEYVAAGKPANIDDRKYLAAHSRYQQHMDEWNSAYDTVAVKAKAYITDYLRSNGYDSMYFAVDGGSFGRQTDSLIVLDENQVKSADPVTYDDDGNVIPLSQRFNPESDDIRYKLPIGTSSRVALVDALDGLARRDEEKRLVNTYRTYIENAQADQERLVKTRKEIARLRKEGDPNKRIPKLQQAVKTIQARLDRNDSALLELEGMEILKGIMERAVREQRQMGEAQRRQMSEQYRADRADAVALQKATDADLRAMEQEFLRLMREYEKQGAKRSQLEGALAGKTADYQVMEKEFLRLMRAYEKESAKREGLEADVAELGEDLESKKQENRDLRENQKLWEAEFRRLMTAYDRADRQVDRLEEQIQQMRESRRRASERRKASEVRGKIKRLKARMQSTLLHPTEKNFVPVSLFETMVSVLELVDDSTEQYKPDGTLNQAQAAREATASRLNKLSRLYSEIKGTDGYQGEFDEYVDSYLRELANKYDGRNLAEMSLNELQDLYNILRSVYGVISEARKLIGVNERYDVYEAADAIAAEQQAITDGRKNGKRNFVGIANDTMNNQALSPMRNIERMAGYDEDSMLVKLAREIEKGVRKGNLFMMRAYKMFEELTASPEYDDALYKEVTVDGKAVEYTDYKGRKFGLSKMQMMQAILSYEREQAVDNLNHIATGGFTFADLRMLRKGKLKEAISEENSHRVPAATEMVLEFIEILKNDKWCQDYMAVAREFFNHMAKDAINEASIATKHRAVATGEAYVPFETDQNFVVKEISAANDVQQTINSYGMLKDAKNNAPQPLIVTGLNNLIERHISQVGTVYGLAVPIRNFNKVWTTKTQPGVDGAPTVRGLIEGNWGTKGAAHIEQAVQDVQGPRKRDQGVFADLYRKLKSNYIGATFLFNLSVVMKQLGSLFTATSMIQWRNPVSMMANLIYTATHFQEIAAEVDQYTASVWMRRQGLSDAELSTLMTEGQKTWLGKLAKKGPAWANPTKWITGMDSAVALSLWRYCKEDVAARTGLEGEALLEATAEFFDDVVENTQSMTDVLHRPEIQKNTNIFSEPFAMFKTDVYQMAGQLNVAAGRAFANPTKENKRALGKTVYSIAMSAVWGQLMTAAFAALRYKMDRYKDDEDELTWKSFLKRSLFSLGGDLAGYVFPIFGSEIVGIGEALAYGETDDFLDNMTMSNVNELYSMIISISNAMIRGKEVSPQKWNKLIAKALQLFGVPTNNIIRLWEAIRKHATDIAEGEFFAFNEE